MDGIDYTSFGPGTYGFSPTPAEKRRAAEERFHSSRAIDAIAGTDVQAMRWAEAGARMVAKRGADQAEMRRILFESAQGQAFRDTGIALRGMGVLGSGDPIAYADQIVRGVTGGGFGAGVFDSYGRQTGFGQQVNGNGVLAERMSIIAGKQIMRNLYGSGTEDPEKLYGVRLEEAGGIASTLMRRGALGSNAMAYKRDATFEERVASARQGAVDPLVKSALGGLTQDNYSDRLADAVKSGSKKVENELRQLDPKKGGDAVFVNEQAIKQVSRAVEEVSKGIASLSDIYGELSSPELFRQLEKISGVHIVSKDQARQATNVVNELRGVAVATGNDPRAVMDAMTDPGRIARYQQSVMGWTGLDVRSMGAVGGLQAMFMGDATMNAMAREQSGKIAAGKLRSAGVSGVRSATYADIEADQELMQNAYGSRYQGILMARGAKGLLSGDEETQLNTILSKFENSGSTADSVLADREARNFIGRKYGKNGDFSSAVAGQGRLLMNNLAENGQRQAVGEDVLRLSRRATNMTPVIQEFRKVTDEGSARAGADLLRDVVGQRGMADIMEIATNGQMRPNERGDAMRNLLRDRMGLSDGQEALLRKTLLNQDGSLKDRAMASRVAKVSGAMFGAGTSSYDSEMTAKDWLNASDLTTRRKLEDKDGGLSLRSIARSLMTNKVRALDTPEALGYAVEAARNEGVKFAYTDEKGQTTDVTGEYQQLDISGGVDAAKLAQIRKVTGADLYDRSKYKNDEEFIAASKSASSGGRVTSEMVRRLRQTSDIQVGGTGKNFHLVTARMQDAVKQTNFEGRMRMMDAARQLFPGLKEGERNGLVDAIGSAKVGDDGLFHDLKTGTAFKTGTNSGETEGGMFDRLWNTVTGNGFRTDGAMSSGMLWDEIANRGTHKTYGSLPRTGYYSSISKQILGANADTLKQYGELNTASGGKLLTALEDQSKQTLEAMNMGRSTLKAADPLTGKQTTYDSKEVYKQLQDAIARLQAADSGGEVKTMSVGDLTVTGSIKCASIVPAR